MTTVLELVKLALPNGSRAPSVDWDVICAWPPDVFAVVATMADRTGGYAYEMFSNPWCPNYVFTDAWRGSVVSAATEWATTGTPPARAQSEWNTLLSNGYADLSDVAAAQRWLPSAMTLLAMADEACKGIGFAPGQPGFTSFAYAVYADYLALLGKPQTAGTHVQTGGDLLPHIPVSLCLLVEPSVACVQPKTSTPSVGRTLRSLSHNLALLPRIGHVTTQWHIVNAPPDDLHFNLLVVPYPYRITGRSFVPSPPSPHSEDQYFKIEPSCWLPPTAEELADFLAALVDEATTEVHKVHGVVLPEVALTKPYADAIATKLKDCPDLELLIAGVSSVTSEQERNLAAMYRFDVARSGKGRAVTQASFQSKHHRWCLNAGQITRYHLGHALKPSHNGRRSVWWEQIDISERHSYVTLFRETATLSVLICEDLARYDPVLTVMNAIGPNLVIALLMDGPQLEQRWCGRYATALADDPGSSVLTVSSLGMLARSRMPGEPLPREVVLWKEPDGQAKSLKLPPRDHALLLTLTEEPVKEVTLDGRSDDRTMRLRLTGASGVRYPLPSPSWLGELPT